MGQSHQQGNLIPCLLGVTLNN